MPHSLRRRIMYRVYISFVISFIEHRFFWQGVLFGASLALFGRLVHVASVASNVLATPLGHVPGHVTTVLLNALADGKVLTVLTVLLMVLVGISFMRAVVRFMVVPSFIKAVQ